MIEFPQDKIIRRRPANGNQPTTEMRLTDLEQFRAATEDVLRRVLVSFEGRLIMLEKDRAEMRKKLDYTTEQR
jgi:hypothetical protein